MEKKTIIFVLGPTASGKSAVAAGLAEKLNGEVVSCDSMQVYKDMDVLTQHPAPDLIFKVPHHLVGIMPPEEEFNAAKYRELAGIAVEQIFSRGKVPVFSGGTGLYVKAFLDGLFPAPGKDRVIRDSLEKQASEKGREYLHSRLKEIDPVSASSIEPGDLRRIIRALEVYELTGKTFSAHKAETKGITGEYVPRLFALKVSRERLVKRIEKRVDDMFSSGLVEEVSALSGREISLTASKALGLAEVTLLISGESRLEEIKEQIKIKTRQYAKRQMTWLRGDDRVEWVDADRPIPEIVLEIVQKAGR